MATKRSLPALCALVAILALFTLGCSSARPSSVTGKVTFDGHPVDTGNIRFDPLEDTPGFGASTRIVGGEYAIPADAGLFAGNYLVAISATRPTGRTIAGEGLPGEANKIDEVEQYVPEKYNARSELRADLSPNANVVDYHLHLP